MTGYALVVDGGYFLPGREGVDPLRHRPPHLPWSREVLGWVGVIDGAVVSRSDTALDSLDGVRDVEVLPGQVGYGLISKVLHPCPEGVGTLDAAGRIRIQRRVRCLDVRLTHEVFGNGTLGLLDAMQFLESPLIRLFEVDDRPEEIT